MPHLKVLLQRAQNLKGVDSDGKSDPYVKLHASSEKSEHLWAKTNVVKNDNSPSWNQSFIISVNPGVDSVQFHVWDHNTISKDENIGSAEVPVHVLQQLQFGFPTPFEAAVKPQGKLMMELTAVDFGVGMAPTTARGATLSEQDVRGIVEMHAKRETVYKEGWAKKMGIFAIMPVQTFHLQLTTFTESRSVEPREEKIPSVGVPIDPPGSFVPNIWDMPARAPSTYCNHTIEIPLPGTHTIITCSRCNHQGFVPCDNCNGTSRTQCHICSGSGHTERRWTETINGQSVHRTERVHCHNCHGDGRIPCGRCAATGRIVCPGCAGRGEVHAFQAVVVKWATTVEHRVKHYSVVPLSAEDHLPTEMVQQKTGGVIWQEELPVLPERAPVARVSPDCDSEAWALIQRWTQLPMQGNERICLQKLVIYDVPVTQVVYEHTDKNVQKNLWIIGTEQEVSSHGYPRGFLGTLAKPFS